MLTDEMKAAGWIEHDGRGTPVADDCKVFVRFRDGEDDLAILRYAFPPHDWNGRWDWWGRTKKPADIIAYKPETPHD